MTTRADPRSGSDTPLLPALLWLAPGQRDLCAELAARAGLRPTVVGSPDPSDARPLATAFGAALADDLRAALVSAEVTVALIADPGAFAADDAADKSALLEARDRGVKVLTFEPMPASVSELAADVTGPGAWARHCPLARLAPAFRDAAEMLDSFGPVRAACVQALGRPIEGSLGSCLLDGMDLLLRYFAEPETVDAAYCAPVGAGRALRLIPGETLRGRTLLHGDICATVRFSGGRAGTITASDQAGRFERSITLIGEGGRIRIDGRGVEWLNPAGELIEAPRSARRTGRAKGGHDAGSFIALAAEQIVEYVAECGPSPGSPAEYGRTLGLAQTALLSARTGEGESPATMQRLAGAR
ncbi:MAG: hypothetical protein ACT4PL_09365 [Phycisphaerales bacterium]